MHNLLFDVGISVIAATLLGLVCHFLKQPIILGYILAGVVIGPQFGMEIVHDTHSIEIISEFGLLLLLFIIGLEINLKDLLSSGKQLLITSIGQYPIGVLLGLICFFSFSLPYVSTSLEVFYLALLCSLSSTAIVVKALYDKMELDTLPGKLTLGTLVLQDLYAILLLAVQPNLANPSFFPILKAICSTLVLVTVGILLSKFVLSRLFHSIAETPEMVVCVSLAWCAAGAAFAGALGVSIEMGALVAGISISAFPYSVHVTAKTLPLRDFFLTLFFVSLGMKMTLPEGPFVFPVLAVSAFVVLSRFLSVYPLVSAVGAGRRAAFITSLNLAQVSEFALVIGGLAVSYQHIQKELVSVLILSMIVLSVISSYAIRFSHQLFTLWDSLLSRVLPETAAKEFEAVRRHQQAEIVFLGFHRSARALLDSIQSSHPEILESILVVDFNPLTLEELRMRGIKVVFGDIASYDTLKHAHLEGAKVILSTIPDMLLKGIDNKTLVRMAKSLSPRAKIVATADDTDHERALRREGVDLAVRPFDLMGEWLAHFVSLTVAEREEKMLEMEGTGRWLIPANLHANQTTAVKS